MTLFRHLTAVRLLMARPREAKLEEGTSLACLRRQQKNGGVASHFFLSRALSLQHSWYGLRSESSSLPASTASRQVVVGLWFFQVHFGVFWGNPMR